MQLQLERLNHPSVSPVRSGFRNRKVSFDLPSDASPPSTYEAPQSYENDYSAPSVATSSEPLQHPASPRGSRTFDRSTSNRPPPLMSSNPTVNSRAYAPHFNRPRQNWTAYNNSPEPMNYRRNCWNCGKSHPPYQCPARGKQCMLCSRFNHFAQVCRSSRRTSP